MIKASAVDVLLKLNAFAPVRYMNKGRLPILMYHRFSEVEEEGKTSRAVFEEHLTYLRRYYNPMSLSEAVDRLSDRGTVAERSVVLTVDDGYLDFYNVALPVLLEFDFPATIYVVTDFIGKKSWIWTDKTRFLFFSASDGSVEVFVGPNRLEFELNGPESRRSAASVVNTYLKLLNDADKDRTIEEIAETVKIRLPELPPQAFAPLTWDQVDELSANGVEIGSHTVTHPILTNIDEERLTVELKNSYMVVAPFANGGRPHFCYPNGNVSQRERDAAKAAGFASAVTTEIRLCNNMDDIFLLPRIDAEPEMRRFVQSTSGFDRLKPWS